MKWFEKSDENLSYISYKVSQTEILVGPKLDKRGTSKEFFDSIEGWLSITESYVEYPVSSNVRWFPWIESAQRFPLSVLYGSLKTLNYWVNDLKLSKIYIHCDLGSHRAPSVLGSFLYTYFKEEQEDIVRKRILFGEKEASFTNSNGEARANPIEYFSAKLNVKKELKYIVEIIKENPSLSLDEVLSLFNEVKPISLYSKDELREYRKNKKEEKSILKQKKKLKEKGFFVDIQSKETDKDILSPYGIITIVYDKFLPEIFSSLEKNKQALIFKSEVLGRVKDNFPNVEIKEEILSSNIKYYLILNS